MAIIGEQLGCGGFNSVWGWQVIKSGKDPVGASRNQQSNALWHETGIETMRRLLPSSQLLCRRTKRCGMQTGMPLVGELRDVVNGWVSTLLSSSFRAA
jgi:hypothetical protein